MLDLRNSIAAIVSHPQGEILGTGFFIDQDLVVTCSHVVLSEEQQNSDVSSPDIVFIRRFGCHENLPARILSDSWSSCVEDDLVILKLIEPVAEKNIQLRLGSSINSQNSICQSFGYPEIDDYEGIWYPEINIAGPVPNRTGRKRLQLSSNKIKGGFSGAPLYDLDNDTVVGIIAEVYIPGPDGKLDDLSFAIPVEALHRIVQQISLSPGMIEILESLPTTQQVTLKMVAQLTDIRDQNRILREWKDQHDMLNNLGFYLDAFYQRVAAVQNQFSLSDGLSLKLNWMSFEQG